MLELNTVVLIQCHPIKGSLKVMNRMIQSYLVFDNVLKTLPQKYYSFIVLRLFAEMFYWNVNLTFKNLFQNIQK